MSRTHLATERRTPAEARDQMPAVEEHLAKLLGRLRRVTRWPDRPLDILDLGAAQGLLLLAAGRIGHRAVGIEPDAEARAVGTRLAGQLGFAIDLRPGQADRVDFPDASFDFVHAASLLEHVPQPDAVLREARRVLRPGGAIWLCTTNRLCPRQCEIARLPAFSWYPAWLQRRIMEWTRRRRPDWIGRTHTPAIHWFTPGDLLRRLRGAGFQRVYDRWDLRLPEEGGRFHATALRAIRKLNPLRLAADIALTGLSFAGVVEP